MAWPEDRLRTYSPNQPVFSTDLNAIQDALIALLHSSEMIAMQAAPAWYAAGPRPTWALCLSNPERGYECLGGIPSAPMTFELLAPETFVLQGLVLKYFNSLPAAGAKPNCTLYLIDPRLDSDAVGPSLGTALGDMTAVTDIPAASWGVRAITGLSVTVPAGRRLVALIGDGTTGDYVAAVNLIRRPVTP